VADPDQAFGGEVNEGDAKKYSLAKGCLEKSLGTTQKWLPFVGHKVVIFIGRTKRFFREQPQFERALYR